jgi:hypothetical protein
MGFAVWEGVVTGRAGGVVTGRAGGVVTGRAGGVVTGRAGGVVTGRAGGFGVAECAVAVGLGVVECAATAVLQPAVSAASSASPAADRAKGKDMDCPFRFVVFVNDGRYAYRLPSCAHM